MLCSLPVPLPLVSTLLFTLSCLAVSLTASNESLPSQPAIYQELYPHGDVFPISGYSPVPEREREAGFSMVGPGRRDRADLQLAECERLQMPFIYPVGVTKLHLRGEDRSGVHLPEAEIRAILTEQVSRVAHSTAIYAWNLHPEELRYWRQNELDYLRIASSVIREVDPLQRPVWMYEPGHRTREALEQTLPWQQIAGKGVYTNYSGFRDQRSWVGWTLDQQNQAIDASNPGILPFAVLEMFREPPQEMVEMIDTWVRHDSYASLLEGVKGIVVFSFGRRSGFPSRVAYYEAYSHVARELNGDLQLGVVFLRGEEQPVPEFTLISGPSTTPLQVRIGKESVDMERPSLKVKKIHWNNSSYLFLVNSSQQALKLRFHTRQHGTPLLSGQPVWEEEGDSLHLPPLGVAVFKETY